MLTALSLLTAGYLAQATGAQAPPKPEALRPYAEVIPAAAKSQDGLFKVHQVGDKFFFEIPSRLLGRDMLWQAQLAQIPRVLGSFGPQASRLVRWSRRENKVYLEGPDASMRSREATGIDLGVSNAAPPAIIAAFKVETEGPEKAAVIDVSDFLISDPADLNVGQSWAGSSLDRNRSYVAKVKAFPANVEMRSLLTFKITPIETLPGTPSAFAPATGPNVSMLLHYSFNLLPEKPMMPRFRDTRVGYFGLLIEEYGGPENRAVRKEIIKRFRLEKRDPSAPISEPVRPIVFYTSRDMPKKWRPYAIKAVEAWQPAFEQAGFKNAIICKEAPTEEEDPDWDMEDVRYSVIRWNPSSVENAFGLTIADPRSGEIIAGHVAFFHNFLGFIENLYFSQVGSLDPQAQRLPFDDRLMGKLLQYMLTHEIGHAIGLEHNMKASSAYTIAQLRDPRFVAQNGIASSIMDYARFDYVAQPGDGVPLDRAIGSYDKFAVEWGYKPVPGASTPEAERPALNAIANRQTTDPKLRFGNYLHPEDPSAIGEDLGDDPILAARLGMQNVRRVAKLVVPATVRPGEDYSQLASTYAALVNQFTQLQANAYRLVGGIYAADERMMIGKTVYRPVPADLQRKAVRFVCGPDCLPPAELISPEITQRLFANGAVSRIMGFQDQVVAALFNERKILRMLDTEAMLGKEAYTVQNLLDDVQQMVWRQLSDRRPSIDIAQRQYQRGYLNTLDGKLNGYAATRSELGPLARTSLRSLARKIDKAIPRAADSRTVVHLKECRHQIETILTGTSPASKIVPPPAAPPRIGGTAGVDSWPCAAD